MRTGRFLQAAPLVILVLAGCGPAKKGGPAAVAVRTAQAERRDVAETLRAVGTVVPVESASVRAQVAGPVVDVLFKEGETVRAGQPLFQIDPRPFEAERGKAAAEVQRLEAELAHAKAQAERYDALAAQGFVSEQDAEAKRTDEASLRASVREAKEALRAADLDVGYARIRAPIAGRAGAAQVKRGDSVKSNEAVLVEIHQIHPIDVSFGVPGEALGAVRRALAAGSPAVMAKTPGAENPVHGTLVFLDNAVSAETGTLALKGRFENPEGTLWPGQVVDVSLVIGMSSGAVAVPDSAVMDGQQGTYAYVVRDGKAERRSLKIGRSNEGYTVILSGVEAGETVVTDGQLRLVDGVPVQVAAP